MKGSSSTVSPFVSGTKKRFRPTPRASAIFSSVPRLGVICPLSILERYERETRERAWSWLCVMPRDSRNWRMRWPIFSTVSRFGQFSNSWRSSPGKSVGDGVGMTNVTFGGNKRRQRRQLPSGCGTAPIRTPDNGLLHGPFPCWLLCHLYPPPDLLADFSGETKGRNVGTF